VTTLINDIFPSLAADPTEVSGEVGHETDSALPPLATLTRGLMTGDESAYRTFYDLYHQRLFRYLLVLVRGDEDAAREALQSTFVRMAKHIRRFEVEGQFWNWLTVLARTAYADQHRKQSRYHSFLDRFKSHAILAGSNVEAGAADTHLLTELEYAIASLSPEERGLVERKYFGGESVRDIATTLQTSDKAVESRLTRVRQKLRESLLKSLKHASQD